MLIDLEKFLSSTESRSFVIDDGSMRLELVELILGAKKAKHWLESQGLGAGDYVACHRLDTISFIELFLAGLSLSCVVVPLNDYFDSEQARGFLDELSSATMLETAAWKDSPPASKLGEFEDSKACLVVFTSGSSADAKGVEHSFSSLSSSARATLDFYGLKAGDSWLLSLGLFHIGGFQIFLRCLLAGMHLLVSKLTLAQAIESMRPSCLSLVPTQLSDLLDCDLLDISSLKMVILGGAPASFELLEKAYKRGLPLSLSYGSSEAGSQITATKVGEIPDQTVNAGSSIGSIQLRIDPVTQAICWKAPSMFRGYWRKSKFEPHFGWFCSQDRGRIDLGRLFVLGRLDDVFQSAGENLSLSTIESKIAPFLTHLPPYVLLKQADQRMGHVVVLYIEGEQTFRLEELVSVLSKKLSSIEQPRRIYLSSLNFLSVSTKPPRARIASELEKNQEDPSVIRQIWSV